jgi:alanine racemase
MRPVLRLQARVIQVRELPAGTPVGYGHAWSSDRPSRIATASVGYADGWLRSLGNRASVWAGEVELPIVGRVSMDTVTIDATALPPDALRPGDAVDLIGPSCDVDRVAAQAGTIGYEMLTRLGRRFSRVHRHGVDSEPTCRARRAEEQTIAA